MVRETRICKQCKQEKTLDHFPLQKSKSQKSKKAWHIHTCYSCTGKKYNNRRIRKQHIQFCEICGILLIGTRARKYCKRCAPQKRKEYARQYAKEYIPPPKDCCDILLKHHKDRKDDPEHLSTKFIKELSNCSCEVKIDD
jgi:hypothetical protein